MTSTNWLEEDEMRVFRAYIRSTRALFVQFDRDLMNDVGMPRTFFEILWHLNNAPDGAMRMSELADRTGSLPSRMTHAIGRLEKDGQVRREHCVDDRRGWLAVLTDLGREALEVASPAYAKSIREHFFSSLSPRQVENLVDISESLLQHLSTTGAASAVGELAESR